MQLSDVGRVNETLIAHTKVCRVMGHYQSSLILCELAVIIVIICRVGTSRLRGAAGKPWVMCF